VANERVRPMPTIVDRGSLTGKSPHGRAKGVICSPSDSSSGTSCSTMPMRNSLIAMILTLPAMRPELHVGRRQKRSERLGSFADRRRRGMTI